MAGDKECHGIVHITHRFYRYIPVCSWLFLLLEVIRKSHSSLLFNVFFYHVCVCVFWNMTDVVRQACRAGGQLRLTFTAGTGEELKARGDDR